MLNRRRFLASAIGTVVAGAAAPAACSDEPAFEAGSLRGTLSVAGQAAWPEPFDDKSKVFQRLLNQSGAAGLPVDLPAGTYRISNMTLPRFVHLRGVPGATRIVYGGDGHLFIGEDADRITFEGIVFDGANRWLGDHAQALIDLRRVGRVTIDGCEILGSSKNGINLEKAVGRIADTTVSGAAGVGIWSVEAAGLEIDGNRIADCRGGGVAVQRWRVGHDGTQVRDNTIERVAETTETTGIALFRANGAVVSGNTTMDCGGSAIAVTSSDGVRVTGNACTRSAATAIRLDLGSSGASISGNVIDEAADGIDIGAPASGPVTCSGNLISRVTSVGIAAEADTVIAGNSIEAGAIGIRLGSGAGMRNLVASANLVRGAPTGVAVAITDSAGSAVVSDNVIAGATSGAVVGYEKGQPVTGDLTAGAADFANLTVERNRVG